MRSILFLVVAVAGCAGMYPTPPRPPALDGQNLPGLARVDANLLRSSQPTCAQLKWLHKLYGVTDVFALDYKLEGRDCAVPGVVEHYRPLSVVTASYDEVMETASEMLATCTGARVCLVHCVHGEDRTGLVTAVYRTILGASFEDAWVDMERRGFHRYRALWRIWTRIAGWSS